MNGVHDMGGMDGMGPIRADPDEPVFHEPWEARVFAMFFAVVRNTWRSEWGSFRYTLESIPAAEYLRMSYYERWFDLLLRRFTTMTDLVTPEELEAGRADPSRPAPELHQRPAQAALLDVPSRFQLGQRVRARNMHPRGHTRLPRYVRGRLGVVVRDHGVFRLQDTDTDGQSLEEGPRHVYVVRFEGRELWGERASERHTVHVDLWEDYLEPA